MKFAIVGYGNMGKIYLKTILKAELTSPENILVLDKDHSKKTHLAEAYPLCTWRESWEGTEADVIILAVKPQDFLLLSEALKSNIGQKTLIVSIMAGITIGQLIKTLNHDKVIRAMPNAPIEFGFGMTAYCSSDRVGVEDIRTVEKLFSSTGRTLYLDDEALMDAVTAVSGSGPAYFFYIIKAMIEAGKELGFSDSAATTLVKQTMLGAFHQLNASSQNLDGLISTVASKGGTTEAALSVFAQNNLKEVIKKAIFSARERGEELSKGKN